MVELAEGVVAAGLTALAGSGGPEVEQVLAYDVAHAAAGVAIARSMLDYGDRGPVEAALTCAFVADVVHDLITKIAGRESLWGLPVAPLRDAHPFMATFRQPSFLASLAEQPGPRHLSSDFEMVQDAFRSFADNEIAPVAEHVHRDNGDVPEEMISGLAEIGAFGLSRAGRVRRLQRRRRRRVHGDGRGDRGALARPASASADR